jgi:hypothetical protein
LGETVGEETQWLDDRQFLIISTILDWAESLQGDNNQWTVEIFFQVEPNNQTILNILNAV